MGDTVCPLKHENNIVLDSRSSEIFSAHLHEASMSSEAIPPNDPAGQK